MIEQLQFGLMLLGDHWSPMVMVRDVLYFHPSGLMLPGGKGSIPEDSLRGKDWIGNFQLLS